MACTKASILVAVDETKLFHCRVAVGCGLHSPINETQIQWIPYGVRVKGKGENEDH